MLSKKLIKLIPRSFDVVGDILIFSDFPEELIKKEKDIGRYLIDKFKNVNVVCRKTKFHSGIYRTKKVKIIGGERRKETIHKENDVRLKLNVETCYFSPRLSNERLRIAKLIKKNETILVMFSGVGPYPLVFFKNSNVKDIYGVEINKIAHKYALENVKLNKAGFVKKFGKPVRRIILFNGDVRKVVPKMKEKFDRVLMPLPKGGKDFLDLAFSKVKKKGMIHYYGFLDKGKINKNILRDVEHKFKIKKIVKCGQLSPGKFRVCFDILAQ